MESIYATLGDDIDRTARASTGLSGQAVIDYLKLLYGLRRQFRSCGA